MLKLITIYLAATLNCFVQGNIFIAAKAKQASRVKQSYSAQSHLAMIKPTHIISGFYQAPATNEGTEGCNISVWIKKVNHQYHYQLTVEGKKYSGLLRVTSINSPEKHLIFTGIKWAEYEGNVADLKPNEETQPLKVPTGIVGVLQGQEITIQNYGNAMNSYIQLAACPQKYIRLVKTAFKETNRNR